MNLQTSLPAPTRRIFSERGLKPIEVLAEHRPHGDRLRYVGGCRCDLCRKANSAYERERKKARATGDWNGIVSAATARGHLLQLSKAGVGRRAVSAASDVSPTVLKDIRTGQKTQIRARTERLILAVTPEMASDHSLMDAKATWKLIHEMVKVGFTKTRIASELGCSTRALQLSKDQVTVRNAARIAQIHTRLMSSDEALIPAGPSLRRLRMLREEEFTEKQLARWLELPNEEYAIPQTLLPRALANRIDTLFERLMS